VLLAGLSPSVRGGVSAESAVDSLASGSSFGASVTGFGDDGSSSFDGGAFLSLAPRLGAKSAQITRQSDRCIASTFHQQDCMVTEKLP
jgi:hypothetical protein